MICRDFPKRLSLNTVSPKVIRAIEFVLNNMPRRLLDYKTPQELLPVSVILKDLFTNSKY